MLNADAPVAPRVLGALRAAAEYYPFERKLVVCQRPGVGRELLRSLVVSGTNWVNFEVTTPRQIAHDLVAADLAAHDLRVADEFDELALLDIAIDSILDGSAGRLAELAQGSGLRQAVASSVRALRLAGIAAPALERARFRDEDKRAQIARMLDEYELRLRGTKLVDTAALLARATASLVVGDARLPDARIYLMPGQNLRGLNGQLLYALQERGAEVLETDPVFGIPRPTAWLDRAGGAAAARLDGSEASEPVGATPLSHLHDVGGWSQSGSSVSDDVELSVFAATSVTSELREVLRRVMSGGLRWDEVEIIATDAVAYGVALDGLAQRWGIAVSYATGLPAARTRPGRAVAKCLEWVQQGYPSELLRQMLERGDVAAPPATGAEGAGGEHRTGTRVSGVAMARRLRSLKVGRGRDRYLTVLDQRLWALELPAVAVDGMTAEEVSEQRAREAGELAALSSLLTPLLAALPADERLAPEDATVAPSSLAEGLLVLLAMVPATTAVDRTASARLTTRLRRIAASITRPATLRAAVAMLMNKLDDRVPAPEADGGAPWIAAGGHLHLSDLEHGGYAARRATFIVGMDAARFPGSGGSDALLVDDDRRRLTGGQAVPSLPTAAERTDERRYAFAALAARLRGRVTFSYSMWDAVEGRALAPAAELLQVYRLLTDDPSADYQALHESVAPAASAVPRGSTLLDSDDVWLHALSGSGTLRRGVATVCEAYPHLAAGVRAFRTRRRLDVLTAYHGAIEPRPWLDPRLPPDSRTLTDARTTVPRGVSATQLQMLGTCPHRYLLHYVLRVRKPDDPELLPEQWLTPRERGSLMHRLYERSMKQVTDGVVNVTDEAFETAVMAILDQEITRARTLLPPPGEAVYEVERERLREDARAFTALVRDDARPVLAVEQKFGGAGDEPIRIALPDGSSLELSGAIDRVDELEDGRLVIVDYKTGSRLRFGGASGAFDGGRRLQHVLYAAAAERMFGRRVAGAEYHFPTRRSENHRARYTDVQMRDGLAVVVDLLDFVRHGWFVPTNDAEDCRFCDYAAVCRSHVDAYGSVTSPPADWSREAKVDVLDMLRRVRR